MSHLGRPSKEITGAFCATCQGVRDVERVESHAATTTFALACGHAVTLLSGMACALDVDKHQIVLYPNRHTLPTRPEDV